MVSIVVAVAAQPGVAAFDCGVYNQRFPLPCRSIPCRGRINELLRMLKECYAATFYHAKASRCQLTRH
jgi:hypothetical protein